LPGPEGIQVKPVGEPFGFDSIALAGHEDGHADTRIFRAPAADPLRTAEDG
jgi:hypothetical protein